MNINDIKGKIVLTNVPNYYVTDETCELLLLKARTFGYDYAIVGPSSADVAKKYKSGLKLGITISYPAGAVYPELKAAEIEDLEKNEELADAYFVTAATGYFVSGHADFLRQEMKLCVKAANGKKVYFFLEAAEMTEEQIQLACEIANEVGVCGLVSSNGFSHYDMKRSGPEQIKTMKKYADKLEIIACGMLNSAKDILAVDEAGADKIIMDKLDVII